MRLELVRFHSSDDYSLGLLHDVTDGRRFLAFTLEDEARAVKVYGETRIPQGTYRLELRTEGGKHDAYRDRFPDIHRGMLWLRGVPGFSAILIHCGNDDEDTAGCLLVGESCKRGWVGESSAAYRRIYPALALHLAGGKEVTLKVIDYDG